MMGQQSCCDFYSEKLRRRDFSLFNGSSHCMDVANILNNDSAVRNADARRHYRDIYAKRMGRFHMKNALTRRSFLILFAFAIENVAANSVASISQH
jgi:hypothetical protein